MRARLLLAAALLLPLAAGPAQASWLPPEPFRDAVWLDARTLLTNDARDVGLFDLQRGTFAPLANASASLAPQVLFAASPDGRWAVYAYGHPRVEGGMWTSGDVMPGVTRAYDLRTRQGQELLPSGATALAAGERHVALAHWTEGLLLAPWGDWSERRAIPVEDARFDARHVRHLALDEDAGVLVAWLSNGTLPDHLMVLDLAQPGTAPRFLASDVSQAELWPEADLVEGCCTYSPQTRMALAPDGRSVALAWSWNLGGATLTRIIALGNLTVAAERTDRGSTTGLAWGPPGLAAAARHAEGSGAPEDTRQVSTLRLLDGNLTEVAHQRFDLPLGTPAWDPAGARVGVGHAGAFVVMDPALRIEGSPRMPGGAQPRDGAPVPPRDDAPPFDPPAKGAPGPAAALLALAGLGAARLAARPRRR